MRPSDDEDDDDLDDQGELVSNVLHIGAVLELCAQCFWGPILKAAEVKRAGCS